MRIALACLLLFPAACGDDGGGSPDAARPDAEEVDAALPPPCTELPDPMCGYTPEPVTPADIPLATQEALARRFNPAMVYTGTDVWAVSLDMLLEHGLNGLERAEHDGRLNFSYRTDESTRAALDPQPNLLTEDWSGLPVTADGGRGYVYFLDFPGTNIGNTNAEEMWRAEWRTIQGSDDPTAAAYRPFQYAHLFWLEREQHLLAIQYFFFYPYDKFTNNHEGDWEHINVVVRYREGSEPTIVMAHFSYHGRQYGALAEDLYRVGDDGDGDHVVAFVGGEGCLNYVDECWCGDTSGATFPWPGRYDVGYWEDVAGHADRPGRAIHASDFTVQLLPRIEDVDFAADPELSWYALPFIAGEPTTAANHAAVIATNNHRAPVGPGPEHGEYDVGIEMTDLGIENGAAQPFVAPTGWTLVHEPPSTLFEDLPPNDNCVAQ